LSRSSWPLFAEWVPRPSEVTAPGRSSCSLIGPALSGRPGRGGGAVTDSAGDRPATRGGGGAFGCCRRCHVRSPAAGSVTGRCAGRWGMVEGGRPTSRAAPMKGRQESALSGRAGTRSSRSGRRVRAARHLAPGAPESGHEQGRALRRVHAGRGAASSAGSGARRGRCPRRHGCAGGLVRTPVQDRLGRTARCDRLRVAGSADQRFAVTWRNADT
jgi:hypothetical protein